MVLASAELASAAAAVARASCWEPYRFQVVIVGALKVQAGDGCTVP